MLFKQRCDDMVEEQLYKTPMNPKNPEQPNTTRDISNNGNNPIDHLAHAIEKIAANKLPMTTPLLKPITASTIIFGGKNEKFELFEESFSHYAQNATGNDRSNENQPFSFAFAERSVANIQEYPEY